MGKSMRGLGKIKSNKKVLKKKDGWFDLGTKVLIGIFGIVFVYYVSSFILHKFFRIYMHLPYEFNISYFRFITNYWFLVLLVGVGAYLLARKNRIGYYLGGVLGLLYAYSHFFAAAGYLKSSYFTFVLFSKYIFIVQICLFLFGVFVALFCFFKVVNIKNREFYIGVFCWGFIISLVLSVVFFAITYISIINFLKLNSAAARREEWAVKKLIGEQIVPGFKNQISYYCNKKAVSEEENFECASNIFKAIKFSINTHNYTGDVDYCAILNSKDDKSLCFSIKTYLDEKDWCINVSEESFQERYDLCRAVAGLNEADCERLPRGQDGICLGHIGLINRYLTNSSS